MNRLLLLIPAAIGTTFAAPPMTARFTNGDILHGNLVGVQKGQLVWRSEALFEPHSFPLEEFYDVLLPAPGQPVFPKGDHITVATLTNGDQVRGALLKADAEEIALDTAFAGEMTFRRNMVTSLDILPRPTVYYAGPAGLDDWNQSEEGGWAFDNGQLVNITGGGSISRNVGAHDRYKLSFDVTWRGGARFRIYASADSPNLSEIKNGYELVCQSQYAYIRKRATRGGRTESVTIGTTGGIREFQDREKARMEFLHDQTNGRIRLMLDDRLVADWREPAPAVEVLGKYLHFVADHRSELRVSRIQMTSWDGVTDDGRNANPELDAIEVDEPMPPDAPPASPRGILLANGDVIDGEAISIEHGQVTLKTPLKTFTLPVSRLRTFSLRTEEEAEDPELTWKPIRRAGDIRAHYHEGGCITFELDGMNANSLQGSSQTFGDAEFDLSAFSRLEFNIYGSSAAK